MRPDRRPAKCVRPADTGQPIGRIESLPILLFILVVAAAMIPLGGVRSHALVVHLPAPWPYDEPIDGPDPVIVTVGLTATQQATVDGRPVRRDRLIGTVIAMQTNDMTPRIVFEPDADAPYGEALQLLGELRRAGLVDWQFCFGGLPAHRDFGRADRPEPVGQRMPGISCDPRLLYAPHPMPVIAEPRPEPPVDYYIW